MTEKAKYKPNQMSLCCGASITVHAHASIVYVPYGGPPDPVEVCDACNNECEPIDVVCGNCKQFMMLGENAPTGLCLGDALRCVVDALDVQAGECDEFGIDTEPRHFVKVNDLDI